MKVLLVQCPCGFGVEMPPLALGYLHAVLKQRGHDPVILDLSARLYSQVPESEKSYWDSNRGYCWYLTDEFERLTFLSSRVYDDCCRLILAANPDAVGFSLQNTSCLFTLELLKRLRALAPGLTVILGGPNCYPLQPGASDFRLMHGIEEYADVVVIGEGEKTLPEVLSRLEHNSSLAGVQGIAYRDNRAFVFTGLSEPIADLDSIPLPDFGAFDLSLYTNRAGFPMMTSRGCVNRCVFCTDTYFWGRYRSRSVANIIEEIIALKTSYDLRAVAFNDSLLNGNNAAFLALCELLAHYRTGIRWGGNCRVHRGLGVDELKRCRAAGCEYLIVGAESASNRVLDLMRKGFTIEDIEQFAVNCRKAGIRVVMNWIVGFPGESEDDFNQTAVFLRKHADLVWKNTFSTLTINQFSYLETHQNEFGVVLRGNHLGLWESADGTNTIDVRLRRLRELEAIEQQNGRNYNIVRQKGLS